jgi:hypothetical protein
MVRYHTRQPEILARSQLPIPDGLPRQLCIRTYPKDTLLADQFDVLVTNAALAIPFRVGLEVAQIPNMAFLVGWGTVCLAKWVDFAPP